MLGPRQCDATAVLVSTRCMYDGMPRRRQPALIMLQDETCVCLSAHMKPIFSCSESRPTRSLIRAGMLSFASQNGNAALMLPGRQPHAWPLGRVEPGSAVAAAAIEAVRRRRSTMREKEGASRSDLAFSPPAE